MKLHIRDIRLANNAGIAFPVCQIRDEGPLDVDKTIWPTTSAKLGTCKNCRRAFLKRYPWAAVSLPSEG